MDQILLQVAIFLVIAAFAAPLARMCGLGSVLGYLLAGALIGPYGPLKFVTGYSPYQAENLLHFSQIGIAFFLFLIGLELRPRRLWAMREGVFLGGGMQLAVTSVLLVGVIWLLYPTVSPSMKEFGPALLIAIALALSCTAFALQTLEERGELTSGHGRLSFSILLFQDVAAIPVIAIIPVFAFGLEAAQDLGVWSALQGLGAIALIIIVGRYVLDRVFQIVAKTEVREALTASALLVVIGVTILMSAIGMSATLGAFIAGVLLANSPYRHQIKSDIEPFEMLLLGVFFIAIGMSMNARPLVNDPVTVLSAVAALVGVKAVVLYAVGRWQGLDDPSARRLAIIISQGGEFSFVIFTAAQPYGIITRTDAQMLTLIVILSMLATPLLLRLHDWLESRRKPAEPDYEAMPENEGHVVIAGFGRVGQIVARILRAKQIPFTALDKDPEQVSLVNQFGNKIYYGDASRLSILEAVETHKARAFVLAIEDIETSVRTAQLVRRYFPHVPIYARARNRRHVHLLTDLGIKEIKRETFFSSLEMTRDLLRGLGLSEGEVRYIITTFKERDEAVLAEDYAHYTDTEKTRKLAVKRSEELEKLFSLDWQKLPVKGDAALGPDVKSAS